MAYFNHAFEKAFLGTGTTLTGSGAAQIGNQVGWYHNCC
jgi:hypothetical protein